MSFLSSLRRWWQPAKAAGKTTPRRRRTSLGFDILEGRTLPSTAAALAPVHDTVTLSAPATLTVSNDSVTVKVTAGARNTLPSTVALLVEATGSTTFQQFETAAVSSTGSATLPLTGLGAGTFKIQASIVDPAGNTDLSSVITVQTPQPDSIALTVPATITATTYLANVQVTAGKGNGYSHTVTFDLAQNGGALAPYATTTVGSTGAGELPLIGMAAGTYEIQVSTTDLTGAAVVSAIKTFTVAPPSVSISAGAFAVGGKPQVTVTASDVNTVTQVAIDVALDGSSTFAGAGDMNFVVETITLTNNKPVTIPLNLPTPYLSSYLVRARVLDSVGNQGVSSAIAMQGPQSDTVTLTVPGTITAATKTASIQVTAGKGNGYAATAYLYTSYNGAPFKQYAAVPLSKTGSGTVSFANLPSGLYKVEAQVADSAGNTAISGVSNMVVSPPLVTITALPLTVGGTPKVVVTASDINAMTEVAIDVGLQGNANFNGAGDFNQTVQTITLTNNQPVTITLNAFPTPLLPSYAVEARVIDSQGNQGTSSTVIMQGPEPDTISLSVPAALTATNDTAIVTFKSNQGNGYPTAETIGVDPNNDGVFQKYATGAVNSSGVADIPLTGLPAGTYQVEATALDPAGNTLVSTPQTVTVAAASSTSSEATTSSGTPPANAGGSQNAGNPLSIIPNVGQVASSAGSPNVQFVVPGNEANFFISPNELDLDSLSTNSAGQQENMTQSMVLVGANGNALGLGQDLQSSVSNFYVGGLTKSNVPNYGQATFVNVYPGINLSYQGSSGSLEYSFTVSPGANPAAIALSFPGESANIDSAGDLVLTLPDGSTFTESAPVAYQVGANGAQQAVTCGFAIHNGQVTFTVGAYNSALPLVIDPYIFTNFLTAVHPPGNGGNNDAETAMAEDAQGNIYFMTVQDGDNFAGSNGVSTGASVAGTTFLDIVVTKLTPAGVPVYTTYIGGASDGVGVGTFNGRSDGTSIAVDASGNVYFTGDTHLSAAGTAPYPTTAGTFTLADFGAALPAAGNVGADVGVLTILNSSGSISQSTYLGANQTAGFAVSLDGFGNIWVAGTTSSFSLPGGFTINSLDPGRNTMFLTKFAPLNITTTGYQYTDLFGGGIGAGAATEGLRSMYIDSLNRIYIVGYTNSTTSFTAANPWETSVTVPGVAQQSTPYISAPPGAQNGFVLQFQEGTTVNGGDAIITYGSYINTGTLNTASGTTGTYTNADGNVTDIYVRDQSASAGNPASSSIAYLYLTGTTNAHNLFTVSPFGAPAAGFNQTFGAGTGTEAYVLELKIGLPSIVPTTVPVLGSFIGIGTAGAGELGGNITVDSQGNIFLTGEVTESEVGSVYFDTNPVQQYPAAPNFIADPFLVVFNSTASSILLGTILGGNNGDQNEVAFWDPGFGFFGGRSLIVDPNGTIWVGGWGASTTLTSFQNTVTANGGASTVYVGNLANTEYKWVTKISAVSPQNLTQDNFEPNDTSDLAANLENFQTTNFQGQTVWGPFANLTTVRHVGGPVGDGLNYNGLFDYDWYQIIPPSTGTLTVSISNIDVLASGANPVMDSGGDLDLYVYQVINGFLYLLGSSTNVSSLFQTVTTSVSASSDILIDVNPYDYTQASYTLSAKLT